HVRLKLAAKKICVPRYRGYRAWSRGDLSDAHRRLPVHSGSVGADVLLLKNILFGGGTNRRAQSSDPQSGEIRAGHWEGRGACPRPFAAEPISGFQPYECLSAYRPAQEAAGKSACRHEDRGDADDPGAHRDL